MYLVADSPPPGGTPEAAASHAPWDSFPVSELCHHDRPCCELARQWFRAMDFAQLNGSDRMSGPRWVRQKFEWGPSRWPLHWCETLGARVIDCGAHSALAAEAFAARGLTAFRAQLVQAYDKRAVDQWQVRWAAEPASDHWLGNGEIYHEANALLVGDDEVKLWDGSAACWLNPTQTRGYGAVIAVRIAVAEPGPAALTWGDHRLPANRWHDLRTGPSALAGRGPTA